MGGSLCASRPKKALTLCCVLVWCGMLTHDDACLDDVCALATHDSNLGYHLPVGRQPTLSFVLLPLAMGPELAADLMLALAV